jgi:hypothetical protein
MAKRNMNVENYVVRDEYDCIDEKATYERFVNEVQALVRVEKQVEDNALEFCHRAFDQHVGVCFGMQCLQNHIVHLLGTPLADIPRMMKRIEKAIKANVGERVSGKPFGQKKGLGGGVFRWSDKAEEGNK